jgi:hypothetical protein
LPPDRKKLAARRARRATTFPAVISETSLLDNPLSVDETSDRTVETLPSNPIIESHTPWQESDHNGSALISDTFVSQGCQPETELIAAPSDELVMFLVEVYFSRVYNAALLFHKPRFLFELANNAVPQFILLSMFALASVFLYNKNDQNDQNSAASAGILGSKLDWQRRGAQWAELASQKVLAQADIPSIKTVQACQTLVLYWFACSQTDRANFHANVAYRICRLLGLHQVRDPDGVDAITAELNRRCLWSCWMTQCISQENAIFVGSSWKEVAGILLPSDDASFTNGTPSSTEYLDKDGEVQFDGQDATSASRPSYQAQFVKLTGIW